MAQKCAYSGKTDPRRGWPGDDSVCPLCERWVRVKLDGNLASHKGAPKRTLAKAKKLSE